MRRVALLLGLVGAAGCGQRRRAPPPVRADGGARVTAVGDAATAAPVARPHGFVVGTVVVAARQDGQVRPLRLDPATGVWSALGGGDEHLFPTEVADGDAVLVVTARGEREGEHVEQLAWVRGPAVDRLGPRAASIRNPVRAGAGALVFESSAHSFRDLYRLPATAAAGAAPTRLTDDAAGNFEPALSPDGATVVFTSSRDGDAELYRMPAAGGRATRLTASARDDWGPRWSPDGRRLAFLSDREGSPRVFVMDADGTDLRRLTTETEPTIVEDTPRWSPDGAAIALVRGQASVAAVVVIDVDRPALRSPTPAGASDTDLAWSPDGAYLLVARHQPPAAAAQLAFVRMSDNMVVATAPLEPLALRWFPPAGVRAASSARPGD